MSWGQVWEDYNEEVSIIISTLAISYILSQWIQDHYYLLEYLFIVLLFGLIHEAWSNFETDDATVEFIEIFSLDSAITKQIALLWFLGTSVFISLEIRRVVESYFGQLSVIQMLAVIVILSRAFVNIYTSKAPLSIFDGQRDTYATYTAGILAFLISYQIRPSYSVYSWEHNLIAIWPALITPWLLFYYTSAGENLPNLSKTPSHGRRRR